VRDELADLLAAITYDDPTSVRERCCQIRERIAQQEVPPSVAEAIRSAYGAIGSGAYVAVRSSGTAEDLAAASFAELHDTYLDVHGDAEVVDAVKACWGSLFTDRATSYRHDQGFDHLDARLAVVVQTMVASDASGVMFTGNPLTAANDELVINASWGLGEAVVQGIVTPDQFTLFLGDLTVRERVISEKTLQIRRSPSGHGTLEGDVPDAQRKLPALSDPEIRAVGDLGRRVMAHYDGIPQDIEWAVAAERVYLLQSRPITAVNFVWDSDVDFFHAEPDDQEIVWPRGFADEVWTGAVTPLMYSHRGEALITDVRADHVAIRVPDYDETIRFYTTKLGFQLEAEWTLGDAAPDLRLA
jgi:pyruvate,water dikinase